MQEKREREERERQERIDEAKASSGPNLRVIEEEKLLAQLKPLNFGIKEIIPDGHWWVTGDFDYMISMCFCHICLQYYICIMFTMYCMYVRTI